MRTRMPTRRQDVQAKKVRVPIRHSLPIRAPRRHDRDEHRQRPAPPLAYKTQRVGPVFEQVKAVSDRLARRNAATKRRRHTGKDNTGPLARPDVENRRSRGHGAPSFLQVRHGLALPMTLRSACFPQLVEVRKRRPSVSRDVRVLVPGETAYKSSNRLHGSAFIKDSAPTTCPTSLVSGLIIGVLMTLQRDLSRFPAAAPWRSSSWGWRRCGRLLVPVSDRRVVGVRRLLRNGVAPRASSDQPV